MQHSRAFCMCVRISQIHLFVHMFSETGHGLTAWLTVMKSRPVRAHQTRKTPQTSPMSQLEQRGENQFIYVLCITAHHISKKIGILELCKIYTNHEIKDIFPPTLSYFIRVCVCVRMRVCMCMLLCACVYMHMWVCECITQLWPNPNITTQFCWPQAEQDHALRG